MFAAFVAVSCAFTWSCSVILFKKSGDTVHPVLLNLLKNFVGLVLMIPTIYVVEGTLAVDIAPRDLGILLASGFLGIGIADALVLKALKDIGAARIAIVECTYSPFVILFSLLVLGETFTLSKAVGCTLVVAAIVCVSITRRVATEPRPANLRRGMTIGILGMFSMAIGIVFVKPIFATVPMFFIIGLRMASGLLASAVVFLFVPEKMNSIRHLGELHHKGLVAAACVLSAYVSMMLWIAGFKYNDASVAAVLNQTSTIFTVILAAIILKERMTPLKVAGTILATSGVLVMSLKLF